MSGRNVLIGLNASDIDKKYKVKREEPLPTSRPALSLIFFLLGVPEGTHRIGIVL